MAKNSRRKPGPVPPPVPPPDPKTLPVSEAHLRFIDEYQIDLDRARAYRVVNPDAVDHRQAYNAGTAILSLPHVKEEIRVRRHAARVRCQVRADNVLRELGRVGFFDINDIYGPDGRLLPIRRIPLDARRCIREVKVRRQQVTTNTTTRRQGRDTVRTDVTVHECEIEVRVYDKMAALDKLCRYLGLAQEIPPLDALLASLPPDLAEEVRCRLEAGFVPPKEISQGNSHGPANPQQPDPAGNPPGGPDEHGGN